MSLEAGEVIRCPSCADPQPDLVEDYVVPERVGHLSGELHDCVACDAEFYVEFDGTVYHVELV